MVSDGKEKATNAFVIIIDIAMRVYKNNVLPTQRDLPRIFAT